MADFKDTIIKTFEYRLRTNKKFVAACESELEHSRQIYNAALAERISCYQITAKSLGWVEQSRHLTDARTLPEVKAHLRTIQSDALERVDEAFKGFFRRVKNGEKPGFPRFKGKARYHTFAQKIEKQRGRPLKGDKLTVPGVGACRVRLSRPIEGTVKQLRITRRVDGWYVLLVCEMTKPEPMPLTGKTVGVYECGKCGIVIGRDHSAAITIDRAGQARISTPVEKRGNVSMKRERDSRPQSELQRDVD